MWHPGAVGVTLGEQLAKGIVAKDAETLQRVLADDVDFRAMTPGRFWESTSASEVIDGIILRTWFSPSDHLDALEAVETGEVGGRSKVTYLLRGHNDDGPFLVEQHAYYDVVDDRIAWLRVACSGYRAITT
jgi:hypothetical protein